MMQKYFMWLLLLFFLSACVSGNRHSEVINNSVTNNTYTPSNQITATPFLPEDESLIEIDPTIFVPDYLTNFTTLAPLSDFVIVSTQKEKTLCKVIPEINENIIGNLTFVIVKPFNTILDNLSSDVVNRLLFENLENSIFKEEIFVNQTTYEVLLGSFENLSDRLRILPSTELIGSVYGSDTAYGIVGFDELTPEWKVVKIDGFSPLDYEFDEKSYFINFIYSVECENNKEIEEKIINEIDYFTNRNSQKITSVVMTGTTALTRATANKMENNGMIYPGEKVKLWFDQVDFRHVSSETAFYDGCQFPDPFQKDLSFCSRPEYIDLFLYLGINVIELTGNHLLDKGNKAFEDTLELFTENGLDYYAGGYSLEEASNPLIVEHNGNYLAFIGCNLAGPPDVWVWENRSGVNRCDLNEIENQVHNLVNKGILPIVTFQYFESNYMKASDNQIQDFRRMVDAGAVIVSGSQSHVPMSMEIYKSSFIHYGLGNLFFDQMDYIINRKGFIDRHIFYDGKYINTELLTTIIEDYAQPRAMNDSERNELLEDAFVNFQMTMK